jgi:hypothetical protein
MKYRVYSSHVEYFSDIVEANSPDEAKSIIDSYGLDQLSLDSADFFITDVEVIENA